jgi:hypothetical protein
MQSKNNKKERLSLFFIISILAHNVINKPPYSKIHNNEL